MVVGLTGPLTAAQAAAGPINATAQGLRGVIKLLSGGVNLPLNTAQASWQTGGNADTRNTAGVNVGVPIVGPNLLGTGAVTATAQPATGGGQASAEVQGLNLLNASTVGADVVRSSCTMTATGITGDTDAANLKVGGQTVNSAANTDIDVPGVLTGVVDHQLATYATGTGRLTYTVRGLDLTLLGGLGLVAGGTVVVAESICSGVVRLAEVNLGARSVVPGNSVTPAVTVTNSGDIAAPNTVITIPAPPAGYSVGEVTTTGGGSCTSGATQIRCTGVTVPGAGSVTVSLPVTVASSAVSAANWAPASSAVIARSTPVAAVAGTTITAVGGGTLVTVLAPQSTGGSVTVTPMTLAAGKDAATEITLENEGPSDATTTVTIPIANRPTGVSVVSATAGGDACTVTATTITCSGLSVPGRGTAIISVRAAAAGTTAPGTTWDLADIRASLNGTAIVGQGRLLTVSDPDVNLTGGVTIDPATAVPGGAAATPAVRVANIGIIPATGTTITLPAPPAGYTVGNVTTTGGGTCVATSENLRCTGVTVPATRSVTVSVPVTLAPDVTANWTAVLAGPVTATSGDSTGQATGPIVQATPEFTLGVTATPPAPGTVRPGQDTVMTLNVVGNGPSDAVDAAFVVVAPDDTTFGDLTGDVEQLCVLLSPTTLRCTVDLPALGTQVLALPLQVSADADPGTPAAGGCVSLNNDTDCTDTGDVPLPSLALQAPLARRLTVTPAAGTVTPGTSGTAGIRLRSTTGEQNLTVTIPRGQLPAGFTPAGGASCTANATQIRCTGVDLTAGQESGVTFPIALSSAVRPPATWTATGITVSDGVETVTVNGALAIAGTPEWDVTATITGPAGGTVAPGGSSRLVVVAYNDGPSDASGASFAVTAPTGTSFDPLTGDAAQWCTTSSASRAVCTVNLADEAYTPQLFFPFTVPANADPFTPLPGACVDIDGNPGCGPDDSTLDPIVLAVPFDRQVSLTYLTAGPVPGDDDLAGVRVTARTAQSDLTVTVPYVLPTGLSVAAVAAGPGIVCTPEATRVVCSNVDIAAGATALITLRVAATSGTAAGTTWTQGGITVAGDGDQVTGSGRLAVVAQPRYALRTTLTPPGSPVPPGGTGDYDVVITNDGPSDFPRGPVGILLPEGTTVTSLPSPTSDVCQIASPGRVVCTFGLPAGSSLPLRIPVSVPPATDPGQPLPPGCIDYDNNDLCDTGEPGFPSPPLATPLERQVTISTRPATITANNTGTAVVQVAGTTALTGLTVRIPLAGKPAAMTVQTPTYNGDPCTADADEITCTGVSVGAGGLPATILVPVQVAAGTPPDVTWASRAITVRDATGAQATGAGLLVRTSAALYVLTADVTGPADDTVLPGGTAVFRTIVGTGQAPADDALVTVQAPVGTTWAPLTGAADTACDISSPYLLVCRVTLAAGATLTWDLPVQVPGNADTTSAITGGCIDLDGDGTCDYLGGVDEALPDLRLRSPLSRNLTISSDNPAVGPGTTGTSTFRITAGAARADMTVRILTGTLPAGLTVAPTGSCTTVADGIECTGISIAAGAVATLPVAVTARPDAAEGVVWTAPVRVTHQSETLTRSVRAATVGTPEHDLDVVVVPPAPGTLLPGGTGDLDITVTNLGPADFPGAVVEFEAPTGTTFVPPAAPLSADCRTTSPTHVVCTFDLPVGPRTFKLTVSVPATATGPLGGGCIDNNGDNRCTQPEDDPLPPIVLGTPLDGRIQLDTDPGTATPGTPGTGYVVVDADVALTGMTVTVPTGTLPAGFTVTGAAGPTGSTCDTADPARIVCTGVDLAAGRNQVIAVTVRTAASLPANVTWTAYAIAVDTATGETVETTGALLSTTAPIAPIVYTVEALTGVVQAGGTATMTVTVDNDGPSDATNVRARIVAPSQTTFGALSGRVATDCSRASSTLLDCRFNQAADAADFTWIIPLLVSGTASADDPVAGGCVSTNDDADCDDSTDVLVPNFAVGRPLSDVASMAFTAVTVAPGDEGTAQILLNSTADLDDLTLTVPTGNRPATFTMVSQEADSGTCAEQSGAIVCTGIDMIADVAVSVRLQVAVDASAPAGARWRGVGVTLADDDGSDPLTSTGLLVSTTEADFDVTVTPGTPSPNPAAPGQKVKLPVTLHNNGPGNAPQYPMTVVLPVGTTLGGPLPAGCSEGSNSRIVECVLDIDADETVELAIPLVVGRDQQIGAVLTGGCIDEVGETTFDYICGGPGDQAIQGITVVASKVDLKIRYLNPSPKAVQGGTVRLGLPYTNVGNDTAAGVRFTVNPPEGVRVITAEILLDASASGFEVAAADTGAADDGPSADQTLDADCTSDTGGDENTVVCVGPDAAVGETSQLWLTLEISASAPRGRFPVTVEISTTSAEGNTVNNFASAQLTIARAADDGDGGGGNPAPTPAPNVPNDNSNRGGSLPRTGQNLMSLIIFSVAIVLTGVTVRLVARDRPREEPGGTV